MAKKKPEKKVLPSWTFEDFKWCIDNDFQVYPVPTLWKKYKIAVRRGGISSKGQDCYKGPDGIEIRTKEVLGKKEFRNMKEVADYLPSVYKQLREIYGEKE